MTDTANGGLTRESVVADRNGTRDLYVEKSLELIYGGETGNCDALVDVLRGKTMSWRLVGRTRAEANFVYDLRTGQVLGIENHVDLSRIGLYKAFLMNPERYPGLIGGMFDIDFNGPLSKSLDVRILRVNPRNSTISPEALMVLEMVRERYNENQAQKVKKKLGEETK